MPAPRYLPRNATYMVQRRTVEREFLLLPDPAVNGILRYSMAFALSKTKGIVIHCACFMSDHYHIVLTDLEGELPKFMERFNLNVTRCINAKRERRGNLWDAARCHYLLLENAESVLEKMVYTLTNPVAAGLVEEGSSWPGVLTSPEEIGGPVIAVKRPEVYFTQNQPEKLELRFEVPRHFEEMTVEEFRDELRRSIQASEEDIRREFQSEGRRFLGAEEVVRKSPNARASSPEERGRIRPKVACRDRAQRIARLKTMREFLKRYRAALKRYVAGETDVVFPEGTYGMRVRFGVRCDGAP